MCCDPYSEIVLLYSSFVENLEHYRGVVDLQSLAPHEIWTPKDKIGFPGPGFVGYCNHNAPIQKGGTLLLHSVETASQVEFPSMQAVPQEAKQDHDQGQVCLLPLTEVNLLQHNARTEANTHVQEEPMLRFHAALCVICHAAHLANASAMENGRDIPYPQVGAPFHWPSEQPRYIRRPSQAMMHLVQRGLQEAHAGKDATFREQTRQRNRQEFLRQQGVNKDQQQPPPEPMDLVYKILTAAESPKTFVFQVILQVALQQHMHPDTPLTVEEAAAGPFGEQDELKQGGVRTEDFNALKQYLKSTNSALQIRHQHGGAWLHGGSLRGKGPGSMVQGWRDLGSCNVSLVERWDPARVNRVAFPWFKQLMAKAP